MRARSAVAPRRVEAFTKENPLYPRLLTYFTVSQSEATGHEETFTLFTGMSEMGLGRVETPGQLA
jgi:hypothetical protein